MQTKAAGPARLLWLFLLIILLAGGIGLVVLASLPYETVKSAVDLLSKDGDLESFTAPLFSRMLSPARLLGFAALLVGAVLVPARRRAQSWLERLVEGLQAQWRGLWQDGRLLLSAARQELSHPWVLPSLGLLTLLAGVNSGIFLSQPMRYDEAYTFVVFASRPLWSAISDYHLPNNHVFHTLLVHISYRLLGSEPWMVRLPAYLAGVLSIPACYLAGRLLYNRAVGLLAAVLLGSAGMFVEFATNARGYTLIVLFFLLSLALGAFLLRRPNRAAWLALAVLSALGFYTIPIMLYPCGLVMLWLLLSALAGDLGPAHTRLSFITGLVLTGALILLLTAILYIPVFLNSGVEALLGNGFVSAMEWGDFSANVVNKFQNTWLDWNRRIPTPVLLASAAGLAAGLLFHRRIARHRVPVALAAALWIGFALLIQRVAPQPRIWFFLLPLFYLLGAAGLVWAEQALLAGRSLRPSYLVMGLALLAGLLVGQHIYSGLQVSSLRPEYVSDAEDAAFFLSGRLEPGDQVLAMIPLNYPAKYYLMRLGFERDTLCSNDCPLGEGRVYALVNERQGQDLTVILSRAGLSEALAGRPVEEIHAYLGMKIYRFDAAGE